MISRNGDVEYEVIRSKRKTADVVIERDGRIVVRAPKEITDERIEDLVEAKRIWIYKNLAEWRDLNATKVLREYKAGEGFLYLGRSYRLTLVADQDEPLMLKNGRFRLRRDVVDQGHIEAAKNAFRDYYIQRGFAKVPPRVAYYAPKIGVNPKTTNVRDLGNRWASCSPSGNLAFHWKCMMAPLTILDYIVVHELCHLHHRHHTAPFWNEIDKILPHYREHKEWLRQNGAGLDV